MCATKPASCFAGDSSVVRDDRAEDAESPMEVAWLNGANEIAGLHLLPFRMDAFGVVDVDAEQLFDPVVAVEAARSCPSCTSHGHTESAGAGIVIA